MSVYNRGEELGVEELSNATIQVWFNFKMDHPLCCDVIVMVPRPQSHNGQSKQYKATSKIKLRQYLCFYKH